VHLVPATVREANPVCMTCTSWASLPTWASSTPGIQIGRQAGSRQTVTMGLSPMIHRCITQVHRYVNCATIANVNLAKAVSNQTLLFHVQQSVCCTAATANSYGTVGAHSMQVQITFNED
jgi:hypothetical protein